MNGNLILLEINIVEYFVLKFKANYIEWNFSVGFHDYRGLQFKNMNVQKNQTSCIFVGFTENSLNDYSECHVTL